MTSGPNEEFMEMLSDRRSLNINDCVDENGEPLSYPEDSEMEEPDFENQTNNALVTRLMDMLAGWREFAVSSTDERGSLVTSKDIDNIYQRAGNLVRPYPDLDTERDAVCRFIIVKVVPLLLK